MIPISPSNLHRFHTQLKLSGLSAPVANLETLVFRLFICKQARFILEEAGYVSDGPTKNDWVTGEDFNPEYFSSGVLVALPSIIPTNSRITDDLAGKRIRKSGAKKLRPTPVTYEDGPLVFIPDGYTKKIDWAFECWEGSAAGHFELSVAPTEKDLASPSNWLLLFSSFKVKEDTNGYVRERLEANLDYSSAVNRKNLLSEDQILLSLFTLGCPENISSVEGEIISTLHRFLSGRSNKYLNQIPTSLRNPLYSSEDAYSASQTISLKTIGDFSSVQRPWKATVMQAISRRLQRDLPRFLQNRTGILMSKDDEVVRERVNHNYAGPLPAIASMFPGVGHKERIQYIQEYLGYENTVYGTNYRWSKGSLEAAISSPNLRKTHSIDKALDSSEKDGVSFSSLLVDASHTSLRFSEQIDDRVGSGIKGKTELFDEREAQEALSQKIATELTKRNPEMEFNPQSVSLGLEGFISANEAGANKAKIDLPEESVWLLFDALFLKFIEENLITEEQYEVLIQEHLIKNKPLSSNEDCVNIFDSALRKADLSAATKSGLRKILKGEELSSFVLKSSLVVLEEQVHSAISG